MKKRNFAIDLNSPVILWLTIIALAVLVIDMIIPDRIVNIVMLLGARRTSFIDPMQYVRLFTHVLVHADIAHYVGNFMMILAIGPMVEEKYGSGRLVLITAITALVTGLVKVIFFPGVVLVGASGIVFMLILMASFTNIRQGRLPITVLLVAILYIGNEVIQGLFTADNVSRISHIIGGLCGAVFGVVFHSKKLKSD
ncbi:MAG: rhomboid family intramembrane serine protease [Oscillospiraceae bacterium]|nr:rhomboid family intramembrane serine protease [Oscillospiraceae bacterium]